MSLPMLGLVAVAIWVLVIPIALGFTLKGRWPQTKAEFWAADPTPWFAGFLWPLAMVVVIASLTLGGLWFMASQIIVRGFFWLGGWFRRFLLGPNR